MISFKPTLLLTTLLAASVLLPETEGAAMVISDDRVRSLDISPVLGRGYSIGTNSFQSTCLIVDETTTPSYNYEYKFTDHSRDTASSSEMTYSATRSFSYGKIVQKNKVDYKSDSKSTAKSRTMSATMSIMRYYSSVREELSPLSEDALTILDQQDYIGFFKSCGPNYVRSLRRAQELTAIFSFTSSSAERSRALSRSLQQTGGSFVTSIEAGSTNANTFKSETSSMSITILGYGLGLNTEGSSTLVSATLEEYAEVMEFAFKSFTTGEDSHNIGMVYGMEIVPWVDNTAFQVASRVLDEEVEVTIPRSLIPRALLRATSVVSRVFTNDQVADTGRPSHKCKEQAFHMDMYGYCCEESSLFNVKNQTYQSELQGIETSLMVCNPVRRLDKSVVKNNMANNGEFVAHLDSIIRYRLNQLYTLEKCLTEVNTFSDFYKYHLLKPMDTVKYDSAIDMKTTVKELQLMLDPSLNYGLIRQMGRELDEFVEMYYQPCIAALFGTNVGNNPDTEPQYFLAYGWLTHDACAHLSCLADNMRWDRRNGGCLPSGILGAPPTSTGPSGDTYDEAVATPFCAKGSDDIDNNEEESCKHPESDFVAFQVEATRCWATSPSTPAYLMSHFCMPRLNGQIADDDHQLEVDEKITNCVRTDNPAN